MQHAGEAGAGRRNAEIHEVGDVRDGKERLRSGERVFICAGGRNLRRGSDAAAGPAVRHVRQRSGAADRGRVRGQRNRQKAQEHPVPGGFYVGYSGTGGCFSGGCAGGGEHRL